MRIAVDAQAGTMVDFELAPGAHCIYVHVRIYVKLIRCHATSKIRATTGNVPGLAESLRALVPSESKPVSLGMHVRLSCMLVTVTVCQCGLDKQMGSH